MNISSISPSIAPAAVGKVQTTPAPQASKPVATPAVKPAADSDGDHDGSGGRIDVKA